MTIRELFKVMTSGHLIEIYESGRLKDELIWSGRIITASSQIMDREVLYFTVEPYIDLGNISAKVKVVIR